MQKTANQIKSSFETLASGHYQIHSFLYAQEFEQQAYENLIYPLMLVYPLGGSLSGTTYSRNYRVIIADRVLKSEGNELEVESDTQLIALDVLAYWMKLGQNERFTITSSNTITPFWEKWGDEVTGHFVDIGIEEFYDFNSCAIPLSGSIPTPVNPCKDARISVNSVVYGNAPSDSNFNVVVKDQDGDLVGSLIGGEWIVNTGESCEDATYTIEDSEGNILYSGSILSGGNLTQPIQNSTFNVNQSDGTLITSQSILAEGISGYNVADSVAVIKDSANLTLKTENILAEATENILINDSLVNVRKSDNVLISAVSVKAENIENYLVADSLIENDATTPTYSQLVKATEGLILPTQEIQNNGVASGFIPSVGTINVTTNAVPTSFTITGRTIDIVVPSGSYDLDLVDRFGNAFPTKQVTANATWDLRTLTPFDWVDIYLSKLTNPPTGAQLTAVYTFFDDLITAGIFQKATAIYPIIGGTADDHKWNARYPFDNRNSNALEYLGSPTHNANGISTNGTSQLVRTGLIPKSLPSTNKQMSVYKRNQNATGVTGQAFGSNNNPQAFSMYVRFTDDRQYFGCEATSFLNTGPTIVANQTDGLLSIRRSSSTAVSIMRKGVVELSGSVTKTVDYHMELCIGGNFNLNTGFTNGAAVDFSYCYVGEDLTDSQETDHHNIVTALQTALSRNV